MSVINQMLRDLDRRQAPGLEPSLGQGTQAALPPPVPLGGHAAGHRRANAWRAALLAGLLVGACALAGLAAIGGWGRQGQVQAGATAAVAVPPAMPTPVAAAASSPAPASVPVPVSVPVPQARAGAATVEPLGLRLKASTGITTPVLTTATVQGAAPSVPARPRAPDTAVAPPDEARQRQGVAEALALAQAQYSSGAYDAALHTVQDAVQAAERTKVPVALQGSLVREWARMELGQGRPAAALEVLARWEPLLEGQPEGWALRANAAQRLGQHAQALQYYATALQGRPTEQRWLLGSAVSSAALSQLAAAADFADKARAVGPVSTELLTYLRQQGVRVAAGP